MEKLSKSFIVALISTLSLSAVLRAQVWREWEAYYRTPFFIANNEYPRAITTDALRNVIVTGGSPGTSLNGYHDVTTVKYNMAGVQQWVVSYDGSAHLWDVGNAVCADAAGNIYVTGTCNADFSWTGGQFVTIKYNNLGIQQWVSTYAAVNNLQSPIAIALDNNGNVYISGNSNGDYCVIKYNPAGVQQWVEHYDGPQHQTDYPNDMVVDPSGNVFVTGRGNFNTITGSDYLTVAYNTNGQLLWAQVFSGQGALGWNGAAAIAIDSADNVYVTGISPVSGPTDDCVTIKYNFNGVQQWVAGYNGPANGTDWGHDVVVDEEGNVYVAGESQGVGTGTDYLIIKYNSQGQQQWVRRFDGYLHQDDAAYYIKLDQLGNLYISGTSHENSNPDMTTLSMTPSGMLQWLKHFTWADNDALSGLAIDADNNACVIGTWDGAFTCADYLTIKYCQTAPNLTVAMTPSHPPIQIPSSGGTFAYDVSITNNDTIPWGFQSWIMQQAPDGFWQSPMFWAHLSCAVPAGGTFRQHRYQNVPASALPGLYLYRGYLGGFPDVPLDSSSFTYEKLTTGSGPLISDWATWEDPGDSTPANGIANEPKEFNICPCHPNPFNPTTAISYELRAASFVSLKVYDTAGRLVTTLVETTQEAGTHQAIFDGSKLASGIYLYSLSAGNQHATGKMLLLK